MRGGKRTRVKRLHTDTLFSFGKITKSFHQELTSFICAFHSGLSTEWFANYTYSLEMAVAVSRDLSGWWTVCLVRPRYRFFSSSRNCTGVLETKEVAGCHSLGCALGDGSSGLAPRQASCVVLGRWPGARCRQGQGGLESWQNHLTTYPLHVKSRRGDPPVPPALLLGTTPSLLVPGSSAPNSCLAG